MSASTVAPGSLPPLSPLQEQFWLLEQLNGGLPIYNICVAVQIDGPLDAAALERGLGSLAERHALLRTAFSVGADGMPGLRPLPGPPRLAQRGLPAGGWRAAAVAEALVPFALEDAPLWRAVLFGAGTAHVLVLVLHHAISDGRSNAILIEDLRLAYAAAVAHAPPAWPAAPVAYADAAARAQARPAGEPALAFWRAELDGIAAQPALPPDRPRPAVAHHAELSTRGSLAGSDFTRLTALAREHKVTPFVLVAAAAAKALAARAGRPQVLLGIPVANRPEPGTARTVGPFAEAVPLRVRAADAPFAQVLAEVRRGAVAALEHAVPFDRLVTELRLPREPGRRSLFDAVLTLRRSAPPVAAAGLTWTGADVDLPVAPFDLMFDFTQAGDALELSVGCDADVYVAATGARLCAAALDALREAPTPC